MTNLADPAEFLRLSSYLAYQLSATPVNRGGVLSFIIQEKASSEMGNSLIRALEYLGDVYGQRRRKLGPLAILHPLRTAYLLCRTSYDVELTDLLICMLHDVKEEIASHDYGESERKVLHEKLFALLRMLDSPVSTTVAKALDALTRVREEGYLEYLMRVVEESRKIPAVIMTKLADRLDNTLDLHIDPFDTALEKDCYEVIFQALFTPSYTGIPRPDAHPPPSQINGALRLYQLYKNALLMSLASGMNQSVSEKLVSLLRLAGLNEAKKILLHIFTYHLSDPHLQKVLLLDGIPRCGGTTQPESETSSSESRLQYLCRLFDDRGRDGLNQRLEGLYADKVTMARTALVFMIHFSEDIPQADTASVGE